LLLIDHQSGLFQTVKDMEITVLRASATTLAKVATLARIPVITSASVLQGPNGPLIPEIHKVRPHAKDGLPWPRLRGTKAPVRESNQG
jgi:nicotinamidase-related amidase